MKNSVLMSSFLILASLAASAESALAQDCGGHRRTTCGGDGCFESESRWAPQLGSCEWNRVREVRNPDEERWERERRRREAEWEDERRRREDEWEREWERRRDYTPPPSYDYDDYTRTYPVPVSTPAPRATPTPRPAPVPPPPPVAKLLVMKQETYFKAVTTAPSIVVAREKCKLAAGTTLYGFVETGIHANHISVQLKQPITGCGFGKDGQLGYIQAEHVSGY